jgi:hypothetical protein
LKENETADRQIRILEWLLEFQKLELEEIKVREAQSKLKELAVVQCCMAKTVLLTEWLEQSQKNRSYKERNSETHFRKRVKQPTSQEVLELHAWLRSVFQHGRPSSGEVDWAVPPSETIVDATLQTEKRGLRRRTYPKLPYKVDYHQAPDEFKWLPTVDDRKKNKDVYLASMVALLDEYDSKVARCAARECEEVFVRSGRQRFCSEPCSQRTRSKAKYDRDPESARRKSSEYYQRVGKWTRVGRKKKS